MATHVYRQRDLRRRGFILYSHESPAPSARRRQPQAHRRCRRRHCAGSARPAEARQPRRPPGGVGAGRRRRDGRPTSTDHDPPPRRDRARLPDPARRRRAGRPRLHRAFPEATIHTTLYDPEGTYPEFRERPDRHLGPQPHRPLRRHHRAALPFLAPASSRLRIDADVSLVSVERLGARLRHPGRRLVYCHAPARWLYQTCRLPRRPAVRLGRGLALAALRPYLVALGPAARPLEPTATSATRGSCARGSGGVRHRRGGGARAVGIDSLEASSSRSRAGGLGRLRLPARRLPADALQERRPPWSRRCAGATTGWSSSDAARSGALTRDAARERPHPSDLPDAQMRWVYAEARRLVAPSHEDFGLTPLEAALVGQADPRPAGGRLPRHASAEGVTGLFFDCSVAAGDSHGDRSVPTSILGPGCDPGAHGAVHGGPLRGAAAGRRSLACSTRGEPAHSGTANHD